MERRIPAGRLEGTDCFMHAERFETISSDGLWSEFCLHESNHGLLHTTGRKVLQSYIAQRNLDRKRSSLGRLKRHPPNTCEDEAGTNTPDSFDDDTLKRLYGLRENPLGYTDFCNWVELLYAEQQIYYTDFPGHSC